MKLALLIGILFVIPDVVFAADLGVVTKNLAQGKAVIVDVRETSELAGGMLEQAVQIATSDIKGETPAFRSALAKLPKDKIIYTYCAVGGRSGSFTKYLLERGYKSENLGGYADLVSGGLKSKASVEVK